MDLTTAVWISPSRNAQVAVAIMLLQLVMALALRKRIAGTREILPWLLSPLLLGSIASWLDFAAVAGLLHLLIGGTSLSAVVAAGVADSQFAQQIGICMALLVAALGARRHRRRTQQSPGEEGVGPLRGEVGAGLYTVAFGTCGLVLGQLVLGLVLDSWGVGHLAAVRFISFTAAVLGAVIWCMTGVMIWRDISPGGEQMRRPADIAVLPVALVLLVVLALEVSYVAHFRGLAIRGWSLRPGEGGLSFSSTAFAANPNRDE